MSFGDPLALVALAVLPVLAWLWFLQDGRRRRAASAFTNLALLPNLVEHSPGRLRLVPPALFLLALAALLVGFARPHAKVSVPRREATVVLAIDVSRPPESVLLLSDGAPQGGRTTVQAAAKAARALHVPVSTVLLGTASGVVQEELTGGYHAQVRVPPSPGTLQMLARATGGEFFRARSARALDAVYKHLATRVGHRTENREVTDLFAGGALVLLLGGGVLSALRFRRVP